jgi:hypothetical protein
MLQTGSFDDFLDRDYSADAAAAGGSSSGTDSVETKSSAILKIIAELREPLRAISPANKEICLQYMSNLSQLVVAIRQL